MLRKLKSKFLLADINVDDLCFMVGTLHWTCGSERVYQCGYELLSKDASAETAHDCQLPKLLKCTVEKWENGQGGLVLYKSRLTLRSMSRRTLSVMLLASTLPVATPGRRAVKRK